MSMGPKDGSERRRPTMKDVAALVGVHQTTVSLALRGHPGIPETTRDRVRQAAAQLGYRPDPALDAFNFHRLANHPIRSAPLMAFVADEPASVPMQRELFEGAKNQADKMGFVLERFRIGPGHLSVARLQGVLQARNVGCILLGALSQATEHVALDWPRFCALKIESLHVQPRLDAISANYQEAARLAVTRLRAKGCRRIGLVLAQGEESRRANLTLAGYLVEHATAEWARAIPPFYLDTEPPERLRGRWREWLKDQRIDALVCGCAQWRDQLVDEQVDLPALPAITFLPMAGADPSDLSLGQRQVGARAVELLAMRWHTNQRGVPVYVSTTLMPVVGEWGGPDQRRTACAVSGAAGASAEA